MVKRENKTKYILLEILGVCFLASAGIFIRKSSLSPINIGLWRMIFSIPLLFVFAFREFKNFNKKYIPIMVACGLFLSGDIVFFNIAMIHTSLANTNLLTNLTAFIVVPVSFFLFKEKVPKLYILGLFIAITGIYILVTGKASPDKSSYLGDLCAAIACIFYSAFSISLYKLREQIPSTIILFFGSFGTVIGLFFAALFLEGIQIPTTSGDIMCSLCLALFVQSIGHNVVGHTQGFLNINIASAVKLLQPGIAAIYSALIFKELLTVKEIIGMFIVIAGVYICKRQYSKK